MGIHYMYIHTSADIHMFVKPPAQSWRRSCRDCVCLSTDAWSNGEPSMEASVNYGYLL